MKGAGIALSDGVIPRLLDETDGRRAFGASLLSSGNPNDVLCGVVGVLLRDLDVGNTGKALSCGRGIASGDGDRDIKGAVTLLSIFMCGDFLPLEDEEDELSAARGPPFEGKGSFGGEGISSDGMAFFRALPGIDLSYAIVSKVFDRAGSVLIAPTEDGPDPIRGRVEESKGPLCGCGRGSTAGGAAELVYNPTELSSFCIGVSGEQT